MTTTAANPDAFLALLSWGLITDAQHDAVLAHPETAALPPIPGPAHALAWMRMKGLITEEQLDDAVDALEQASPAADTFSDAEDAAYDAEDLLELAGRGITHEAVNALYKDGLIDAQTRDMALEETPFVGTVPAAPAATLAWMVTDGPLEQELFDATRAQVEAEPAFAMAAERARIVAEAQTLIAAEEQALGAWRATAQRKRRVGAWKAGLVTLAIVGGLGWYLFAPASVPACDADSTRKTLQGLMLRLSIDARMQTLDPRGKSDAGFPTLSALRQVGYRKDERLRGCMATMTQGGTTRDIAYTIGPASAEKPDKMMVRGADAAIVQARFGHLDANGKPLYNADPIGRAALEKAFRDGVDSLRSRSPSTAMLERLRQRQRSGTGLVETDPQREREIADIEPSGACRAQEGGQVCPLVVEYNDRLLGAIGGAQSIALKGEFGFVQEGGSWRAGDDFAKRFTQAVLESRLARMGVRDAAAPQ